MKTCWICLESLFADEHGVFSDCLNKYCVYKWTHTSIYDRQILTYVAAINNMLAAFNKLSDLMKAINYEENG